MCVRFKYASFYRRFQSFQSLFGSLFSLVSIAVWITVWTHSRYRYLEIYNWMKPLRKLLMLKWRINWNTFLVHVNFNVSTKIVLSMSQLTLTDADQRFSSSQTLSSKHQNALNDVRVMWTDERDLQLNFGGLKYSYSLFSHKISIEIIRRQLLKL